MFDFSHLRLCFVAGTLEHGGAERQLFYILQTLRHAGATARLLSLGQGEFWEERIKQLGVSVTCVGTHASRVKRLFRVLQKGPRIPPDYCAKPAFLRQHLRRRSGQVSSSKRDRRPAQQWQH